ncbi:MAG: rhomboid family intramembrane serine protease [Armatimonadota bacterium]
MLIPLRTDRPRLRPAYLTLALIALNVGIFLFACLLELSGGGGEAGPAAPRLVWELGLHGSSPRWYSFFTHMFLHGNLPHLVGNMLFLWIFGSLIEDALRPAGMLTLYLAGGLAAAATHLVVAQHLGAGEAVPMVGASGAIAAVMGLFLLRFHRTRLQLGLPVALPGRARAAVWVRSGWALGYWVALEVVTGIWDAVIGRGPGGVAHWAHVGGFAAGALVAVLLGGAQAARREFVTDDPQTNVEYLRRGEAADQLERRLKATPHDPELLLHCARARLHAGECRRAADLYAQAVESLVAAGQHSAALQGYLELLELAEYQAADLLPPGACLLLARMLEERDLARAVSAYGALARRYGCRPEGQQALLRLAELYAEQLDRPFDALECLEDFLRRYPENEQAPHVRSRRDLLAGRLRLGAA